MLFALFIIILFFSLCLLFYHFIMLLLSRVNERCFSLRHFSLGGGGQIDTVLFFKCSRETAGSEAKPLGMSRPSSILHLLNPGVVMDQVRSWRYHVVPKTYLAPSP